MYSYEVATCVAGEPSTVVYKAKLDSKYVSMETKDALEELYALHKDDYTLPIEIKITNNNVEV